MPAIVTDLPSELPSDLPRVAPSARSVAPSIIPTDLPAMSDDECLARLAQAIEEHDAKHLEEVARLIGRLAVTIE